MFDISKIILMQLYTKGDFHSISSQGETKIRNQIFDTLKQNKIDEEKIKELLDFEYPYIKKIYIRSLDKILNQAIPKGKQEIFEKLIKDLKKNNYESITASDYEGQIKPLEITNEFFLKRLEDFKYYEKNKEHRDQLIWASRDSWYKKTQEHQERNTN